MYSVPYLRVSFLGFTPKAWARRVPRSLPFFEAVKKPDCRSDRARSWRASCIGIDGISCAETWEIPTMCWLD
jgi:hypothetical protein